MPELIPVEHDPFTPMRMTPVDHDPFMVSPAVIDTMQSVPFDYGRQPDNAGPMARVGPLSQAQTDYARALINTPRIPGQNGGPSLEPVEHTWQEGRTPSFAEALSGGIQTGFRAAGMDTYDARHFGNVATSFGGLFPPVGIPMAADELYSAAQNRDLFGGALAAVGLLPMAKGALTAAKGVASEVAPAVRGIRAFHGSPHDFPAEAEIVNRATGERRFVPLEQALHPDIVKGIQEGSLQVTEHPLGRFSLDKIGTGEGAQAYGHGLYFAEGEGVAQSYRDQLARSRAKLPDDLTSMSPDARQALMAHADTDVDAMTAAKRAQYRSIDLRSVDQEKLADLVTRTREAQRGKMYEVNIKADPEHFLDWDKPLSEQSQHVRDAVGKIGSLDSDLPVNVVQGKNGRWFTMTGDDRVVGNFDGWADKAGAVKGMGEIKDTAANKTVGEWFKSMNSGIFNEEKLRDAGIPGIRYLDQGSRVSKPFVVERRGFTGNDAFDYNSRAEADAHIARAVQRGDDPSVFSVREQPPTRNYVAFDDKIIDIIRKYGIAGLMGGAAAYGALRAGKAKADTPTMEPFDYAAGLSR